MRPAWIAVAPNSANPIPDQMGPGQRTRPAGFLV
jgi:hypothetical protein